MLGKGFPVFLGEIERWLEETIVSSKVPALPMDLNMNFISKFNHSFTNGDCLPYARKLYTILRKKKAHKADRQEIWFFFLQNVEKKIFKILEMFGNNIKYTRAEKPVELTQN